MYRIRGSLSEIVVRSPYSLAHKVLTGRAPPASATGEELASAMHQGKTLLDCVVSSNEFMEGQKNLLLDCLQFIPEHRPNSGNLVERVEKLLQETC